MRHRATARIRDWQHPELPSRFWAQAKRGYEDKPGHPCYISLLMGDTATINIRGGKDLVVNEIVRLYAGAIYLGEAEVLAPLEHRESPWTRMTPRRVKGS